MNLDKNLLFINQFMHQNAITQSLTGRLESKSGLCRNPRMEADLSSFPVQAYTSASFIVPSREKPKTLYCNPAL